MKIKISRSFSSKIQLNQFEPIESFCAAEAEVEVTSHQSELSTSTTLGVVSSQLDEFCRAEVKKTLLHIEAQNLAGKDAKANLNALKHERKDKAKDAAEDDAGNIDIQ